MQYSPFGEDTKLQFSGHETFPLRYGWLKKVHDAIYNYPKKAEDNSKVFSAEEGVLNFGVGKNMVSSMRYWALAVGIIESERGAVGPFQITDLGKTILDHKGHDPWMEDPESLWLVHWKLASTPERTSTWYWVFNHCPHANFDRSLILEHLTRLCVERGLKKVATTTIKRDIEVFARTYLEKTDSAYRDDTMECPLSELGLLEPTGQKEGMRLVRGPKPTLTDGMFAFATAEFWLRRYPNVGTLSFDSLLHEPGSPGRVFLLDEASLTDLVTGLEATTRGAIAWSESTGLRQLVRAQNELPGVIRPEDYLYRKSANRTEAAA